MDETNKQELGGTADLPDQKPVEAEVSPLGNGTVISESASAPDSPAVSQERIMTGITPEAPVIQPSEQSVPTGATPAGTSLDGPNGPFPAELNRWNWGAFCLHWIWSIGNSTWIGLLALISPISLIIAIILGVKGNEWAWKNRKFESVEQFKKVQHIWAVWGLVLFLVGTVGILFTIVVVNISAARHKAEQKANTTIPVTTPTVSNTNSY